MKKLIRYWVTDDWAWVEMVDGKIVTVLETNPELSGFMKRMDYDPIEWLNQHLHLFS